MRNVGVSWYRPLCASGGEIFRITWSSPGSRDFYGSWVIPESLEWSILSHKTPRCFLFDWIFRNPRWFMPEVLDPLGGLWSRRPDPSDDSWPRSPGPEVARDRDDLEWLVLGLRPQTVLVWIISLTYTFLYSLCIIVQTQYHSKYLHTTCK
jgi:hypothetical protein